MFSAAALADSIAAFAAAIAAFESAARLAAAAFFVSAALFAASEAGVATTADRGLLFAPTAFEVAAVLLRIRACTLACATAAAFAFAVLAACGFGAEVLRVGAPALTPRFDRVTAAAAAAAVDRDDAAFSTG